MKVLQINSVCGYGSTGRIATDLYNALEENGHTCCIAYGRGTAPQNYKTIKIGNKINFANHIIKTRLLDGHGFGSKRATQKLLKKIDAFQPDIIHLHNIHGYYVNIELLFDYLSNKKIPVVWLLHDQWSISPHAANFDVYSNDLPIKNQYKRQRLEYPKSFFDFSSLNYKKKKRIFTSIENMTIITPSYWLKSLINKSFLNVYPIKVIHNGIDLRKFKPSSGDFRERFNLKQQKIILGVASVWSEKKGLNVFNKLAEKLGENYQIVLVGIKDSEKKKVNKKIITINRTESIDQLAQLYTTADIFLNPTLQDNFPTTNIESLACGTPVITFDTGGSSESISKETGKVVTVKDVKGLVKEIKNFNFENIEEKCLQQAKQFDKTAMYSKYIEIYKEMIKNNED